MKRKLFLSLLIVSLSLQPITIYAQDYSSMSLEEIESEIERLESELKALYELKEKTSNSDDNTNETSTDSSFVEDVLFWFSPHGYQCVGYKVVNPCDCPIYFKMDTVFLNENKESIGIDDDFIHCIGPGEEAFLHSYNETAADSVRYTHDAQARRNIESASQYMDYSVTTAKNKLTFTVNNTSSKKIESAKITVVYYKDSAIANVFDTYIGDYANIPANGTVYEEIYYSPEYTSYDVYLTGYFE